ncbi:MAG TPA: 3-deoxy-manno-octulosonate-8-phosphatase KdsC [Nitrospirota bacterium]
MLNPELYKARAEKIKLLILDVDGVLTGGQIILDNVANEYKSFNVRDGHGIKLAQRAGITVAIITGRESRVVEVRAAELGITEVYQHSLNKVDAYTDLVGKLGITGEEVAYVGDDIVDIPVMRKAGLSFAVADAEPYVRAAADMVTERGGGKGAVREVIDYILMASSRWDMVTGKYFV